jgi:hypothetical protein
LIEAELKKHFVYVKCHCYDGDRGLLQKTFEAFEEVKVKFGNTRWGYKPYKLINRKHRPRACPDPLHLLKRIRYRMLKNLISLSLNLEGICIDHNELAAFFKDYNKEIFVDSQMNKMRDILPL